jgi:hypothetical protein
MNYDLGYVYSSILNRHESNLNHYVIFSVDISYRAECNYSSIGLGNDTCGRTGMNAFMLCN